MKNSRLQADFLCKNYLDFTDDLVYEIDLANCCTFLNRRALTCLGLSPVSSETPDLLAFVYEDDRNIMQQALQKLTAAGFQAIELDTRMVSLNGSVIRTHHKIQPLHSEDGQYSGAFGVARDVTEVRRLEEQLQQSQKLETIGMLAGGIAHDFNNMLAAILGYTQLMLDDRTEDDPDFKALTYIETGTERAAALVKQLLIFSRKSGFELKPVRLGALIRETLDILKRTLPKTIQIETQTDEENDVAMADSGRLQQAIVNICLNARDAMDKGGVLRIEVDSVLIEHTEFEEEESELSGLLAGQYVRIRIGDTGSGIPPEVAARIWEPFFTTKPPGEGTGLGLAVVQGILQTHHGHIQVESRQGQGTTFSMYIPAANSRDIDNALTTHEPPGGNETILIVDDEPMLLDLLSDILQHKGYKVLAAGTSEEALEYVDAVGERIDLVISDNMMPGMTGRELAYEILRRYPETKILVCSGFSPTRESEIGNMDYVASYVQKPYQRKDLLKRVRQVLDARKSGE